MKNYLLFALILSLFSCEKEGVLTQTKNYTIQNNAVKIADGTFVPTSGIEVSGTTSIYQENNKLQVAIENITISEGPDLKVYLSKTNAPNEFINLGNFKGNGNSVYPVPSGVSVQQYPYVLIHCQQHNHLFAIASLNFKK